MLYWFLIFEELQGAEDELKYAVGTVRPVSVAFEVVNGFRFYKGGVYTSNTCGSAPMVSGCFTSRILSIFRNCYAKSKIAIFGDWIVKSSILII